MKKIMKKSALMALLVFGFGYSALIAQPVEIHKNPKYGADSISRMECANDLSTMSEFMKINLPDYALTSWQKVFNNCPESSKNIYIYGVRIYRNKLNNITDPELKATALDTLMLIYDKRAEYYGQEGLVMGRKGLDLLKYDPSQVDRGYELLNQSVEKSGVSSEPAVMVTLMNLSNGLFRSGKIEGRELIDNYLVTTDILEKRIQVGGKYKAQAETALENIEAIFAASGAADCPTLVEIFTPKFDKTPNDLDFLTKLTSLLINQKCEDTELFAQASENLYTLEPSSQAAYNLAVLFFRKDDLEKAVVYYEEAINREEDLITKAKFEYELGLIQFSKYNDFTKARSLARDAITHNPEWGAPYILIGNLYASSSNLCGENEFEKSTIFWVAVDNFARAKSVDPESADEANELINKYSQYFPNVEDAFFYGFENGQSYTVGCWINEKTTVRSRQIP
jgi:tetratricopeptide (TPR) repeat protein